MGWYWGKTSPRDLSTADLVASHINMAANINAKFKEFTAMTYVATHLSALENEDLTVANTPKIPLALCSF